jgi:hypothetical protein
MGASGADGARASRTARLRIVGVGFVAFATLFLPWFREQRPDGTVVTSNAWAAGPLWAVAITALIVAFVVLAIHGTERDVRALPYAAAAGFAVLVVTFTRCWLHLAPDVPGGDMERRWGLFVALNTVPLFGWALQASARAIAAQMAPAETERDHGYAI